MELIAIITLFCAAIHTLGSPVMTSSIEYKIDNGENKQINWTHILRTSVIVKNYSYEIQDGAFDMDGLIHLCDRNSSLKSCRRLSSKSQIESSNSASSSPAIDKQVCGNFEDLSSLWNTPRVKTLARNSELFNITFQDLSKRRRKRSTPNVGASPCSSDLVEKVFVYLYYNDTQYEVYHNIQNHLYQTFYVRDCADSPPVLSGHTCKAEFIKSKAAVFNPITDEIEVKNVFVPATCTYQVD